MDLSAESYHGTSCGGSTFTSSPTDNSCFGIRNGIFLGSSGATRTSGNLGNIPNTHNNSVANSHHDLPEVEHMVAASMTKLTAQDRNQAMNEIHGVLDPIEEDPKMIDILLEEMETTLEQLKRDKNRIKTVGPYVYAEQEDPFYVSDADFRLRFLRTELYNPQKAAKRMLLHFFCKQKLFGKDRLTKDITLSDLDEDALFVIDSGTYQISPNVDRAGRMIFFSILALRRFSKEDSMLRAQWYLVMSMAETAESQRRGIVVVVLYSREKRLTGRTSYMASGSWDLVKGIPLRLSALHICLTDKAFGVPKRLTQLLLYALKDSVRARTRIHTGTNVEWQYDLTSFGVPHSSIPVSLDGEVSLNAHRLWVQSRIRIESNVCLAMSRAVSDDDSGVLVEDIEMETEDRIVIANDRATTPQLACLGISDNDVLFGRTHNIITHIGNERLRRLVDERMPTYTASTRSHKRVIAEDVIRLISNSKGRFMRQNELSQWQQVDLSTTKKKVAHEFRNRQASKFFGQMQK